MANEHKPEAQQSRRITLDPSKFIISDEGQLIVTDPEFVDALRAMTSEEDAGTHGILIVPPIGLDL